MICVENIINTTMGIFVVRFSQGAVNISMLPDTCGVCKGRHAESASFREERISFDKGMTQ